MPLTPQLRLLAACLALAISCVSGCGGSDSSSGLPLEDDFSDCSRGWSTDTDDFVALGCAEGGYRVLIKNPERAQSSRVFLETSASGLAVEVDATYEAGPQQAFYGVGCWATPEDGYIFGVTPGAAWAILRWNDGGSPPQTVLAESDTEGAIAGFSDTNRIRGDCEGNGEGAMTLTLSVNGEEVGSADDPDGLAGFSGFGVSVFSVEPGTDVRFDDFAAQEVTAAER